MKIIISEKQQKLLIESKSLESVQNLIDQAFEELKEKCEKNWVEPMACDQMETVEEVKVVASEKGATMRGGKEMKLWFIEVRPFNSIGSATILHRLPTNCFQWYRNYPESSGATCRK